MQDFRGHPNSFHAEGRKAKAKIEESRNFFAECLNVNPSELFFQYDTHAQTKQLIDYCVLNLDIKHIVTSIFEGDPVLNYLNILESNNKIKLYYVKTSKIGEIDLKELDKFLSGKPKSLISLSHVNKYNGMLLPVKDVLKLCQKHAALSHLNLNSSIGKYHIDIQKIKADFVSIDFSEQYGNKNTGVFFFNQSINIQDDAYHKFKKSLKENENIDVFSIRIIYNALYNSLENLQKNTEQIKSVRNYLNLQLNEHFGLKHILAQYNKKGIYTILSFFLPENLFSKYIAEKLDIESISVAKIVYPAKLYNEPGIYLRFAIGKDNTKAQVDTLVDVLKSVT